MPKFSRKSLKSMFSMRKLKSRRSSFKKKTEADPDLLQIKLAETQSLSDGESSPASLDLHQCQSFCYFEDSSTSEHLSDSEMKEAESEMPEEPVAMAEAPSTEQPVIEANTIEEAEEDAVREEESEDPYAEIWTDEIDDIAEARSTVMDNNEVVEMENTPVMEEVEGTSEMENVEGPSEEEVEEVASSFAMKEDTIGETELEEAHQPLVDSTLSFSVELENDHVHSTMVCVDESSLSGDSLVTEVASIHEAPVSEEFEEAEPLEQHLAETEKVDMELNIHGVEYDEVSMNGNKDKILTEEDTIDEAEETAASTPAISVQEETEDEDDEIVAFTPTPLVEEEIIDEIEEIVAFTPTPSVEEEIIDEAEEIVAFTSTQSGEEESTNEDGEKVMEFTPIQEEMIGVTENDEAASIDEPVEDESMTEEVPVVEPTIEMNSLEQDEDVSSITSRSEHYEPEPANILDVGTMECPRLVIDCDPLPAVEEGGDVPVSPPSSCNSILGGNWEALDTSSTKSSGSFSFTFENTQNIWRRQTVPDDNSVGSAMDVRIVFTPSEDMEDTVDEEKTVKGIDFSANKNNNSKISSATFWKLISFVLIAAFLSGQPGKVINRMHSASLRLSMPPPPAVTVEPEHVGVFLNSKHNVVGSWLKKK